MDFTFETFSTRSFERFAQAMALHVLGNGVMVFGDGPDGAREASFDGTLNFPTSTAPWSGYTVMQAKFLQVPSAAKNEADWLMSQMRTELEKFESPSNLRAPDFYILVTNARLSPMPQNGRGRGGIAKLDQLFEEYKKRIGLKDYRIWHRDQLSSMLMDAPEIRRSYAAWLSSSDVISDLLENLHFKSRQTKDAMYRYLIRELRAQQPVRLQQAGHSGDALTMIEDVFTDLPFCVFGERGEKDRQGLLKYLLTKSRNRFQEYSPSQILLEGELSSGKVLLLGGPGQGKSTLSQFMAQIARAAILRSDRPGQYPPEVERIVESTLNKATNGGLDINIPLRFPIRVDLPNFADSLSNDRLRKPSSLIEHIANHITTISGESIETAGLREWIAEYPTLLILDGLDEVPPSANRSTVIRAINEFWDEAPKADVFMVVTTRPQGYNDDLDPAFYGKLEMTALNPELAVSYARKLADARITDPTQRDRVVERLSEAAKNATTARLMNSPLQVAILLALIDQRGDAPTDRWSLFDKYFNVVLEREQGKAGPVGATMRHWGRQIAALHHKVGFLLQVEAESQGSSEAYLTSSELTSLIRGQLLDEEFEDDELERITTELCAASTERLVLIVQREDDRYSFEVRSLQEFMAAAHLMTGREATVQQRLRVIANRSHWLHVFQIAASKCFAVTDSEQYRDTIITTCQEMNESGEEIDRLLRTGSRLALALLEDGLAYDQPKYRRLLLALALDLLSVGPAMVPEALCEHCNREPSRTLGHIRSYLSSTLESKSDAAWKLLLMCSAREQVWARELIGELCEDGAIAGPSLIRHLVLPQPGSWLFTRLRSAIEDSCPFEIYRAIVDKNGFEGRRSLEALVKLYPCLGIFETDPKLRAQVRSMGEETPLSFRFVSVEVTEQLVGFHRDLPVTPQWRVFAELWRVLQNLNAESLANFLDEATANGWLEDLARVRSQLPWPISTLLVYVAHGEELAGVTEKLRSGVYGDIADWAAAEQRWVSSGVTLDDIQQWADGNFLGPHVGKTGAPYSNLQMSHGSTSDPGWINKLISIGRHSSGVPRMHLRHIVQFVLTHYAPVDTLDCEDVKFVFGGFGDRAVAWRLYPEMVQHVGTKVLSWPETLALLDNVGKQGALFVSRDEDVNRDVIFRLATVMQKYPGILVLIAVLSSSASEFGPLDILDSAQLEALVESQEATVRACAKVILAMRGERAREYLNEVLRIDQSTNEYIAVHVLDNMLSQDVLPRDHLQTVSEDISAIINQRPETLPLPFMKQLRGFADTRPSALRSESCWRTLDLGERLFTQTTRRRETMN